MTTPGEKYLALLKAAFPEEPKAASDNGMMPSFWFTGLRGYLELVQVDSLEVDITDVVQWSIRVTQSLIEVKNLSDDTVFVLGFDSGIAIYNNNPCTLEYLEKVATDIDALIQSKGEGVTALYFSKAQHRAPAEMDDWPFASHILRLTGSALDDYRKQTGELQTHTVQSIDRQVIQRDRLCASLTLLMSEYRPKLNDDAPLPTPTILEFERTSPEALTMGGGADRRFDDDDDLWGRDDDDDVQAPVPESHERGSIESQVSKSTKERVVSEAFEPIMDLLSIPNPGTSTELPWIDEYGRQRYLAAEPTKVLSRLCFEQKPYRPSTTLAWPDVPN